MKMEKQGLYLPVAVVILAVAVFLSGSFGSGSITVTQDDNAKTITASGEVQSTVAPDRVRVSFGVETDAATAADAQSENSATSNRILQVVSNSGIPSSDVKTTQLSVYPNTRYDPISGKYVNEGYKAVHMITVETSKLQGVGELIDAVVDAGANRVDQVYFFLSEEKERELRNGMLGEAASKAKTKAEGIASGLGSRIVGVRSASESSFYATPYYFDYALSKSEASAGGNTQISPGDVDVTASVSVSFEIA